MEEGKDCVALTLLPLLSLFLRLQPSRLLLKKEVKPRQDVRHSKENRNKQHKLPQREAAHPLGRQATDVIHVCCNVQSWSENCQRSDRRGWGSKYISILMIHVSSLSRNVFNLKHKHELSCDFNLSYFLFFLLCRDVGKLNTIQQRNKKTESAHAEC